MEVARLFAVWMYCVVRSSLSKDIAKNECYFSRSHDLLAADVSMMTEWMINTAGSSLG